MWVAEQRLVRNGNSTAVTIPRTFLHQLGWLTGRGVVLELDDDTTQIIIRLPRASDFGPVGPPRVVRVDKSVTS